MGERGDNIFLKKIVATRLQRRNEANTMRFLSFARYSTIRTRSQHPGLADERILLHRIDVYRPPSPLDVSLMIRPSDSAPLSRFPSKLSSFVVVVVIVRSVSRFINLTPLLLPPGRNHQTQPLLLLHKTYPDVDPHYRVRVPLNQTHPPANNQVN